MALKQIPLDEQSLLCASVYINNFKRAIEELVYNSLDAASTSIAIRISIQENFIQVLDNGIGIKENNFTLLGQKYASSKYVDINTLKSASDKYGFRGLSLASIIDVSESVKIFSQYENSHDTWQKTFLKSKVIDVCKSISRPSKGTTVEIKGFLYNLNIQRQSIDLNSEIYNIKTALYQLSLVHCGVSISLRDETKNDIIFKIHKNRDIYKTLWILFEVNEKDLQELQVQKNEYKVKAYIGKKCIQSRCSYQWIYLNGKFISKSVLHKKITENISKILYGRNNNKSTNMNEDNNYFNLNIPFYFMFISCPNYDFDIIYTSEKSLIEFKDWKEINKLIEKLVQFYCEESCLVSKQKEINKIECNKPELDTRTKVKEIMEKILNAKTKDPKISQLQNGVKGNILKRKHIKLNISAQKNKKNCGGSPQSRKFPKLSNVKEVKKQTLLKQDPSNVNKSKHSKITSINFTNIKQKLRDLKKTKKSTNDFYNKLNNNECIIKKFEAPTSTLKRRCKNLNRQVEKLLDKYIWKGSKIYNNITKKRQVQNYSETIFFDKENEKNHVVVKKSSDLIRTVVTNQSNMTLSESIHRYINTYGQSCRKDREINNYNEKNPVATYNSHNYCIEAVNQTVMSYIINEKSTNNFYVHEQKLNFNQQLYEIGCNKNNSSISNKCNQGVQETEKNDCSTDNSNARKNNQIVTPQIIQHMKSLQFDTTYTVENYRSVKNNDQLNKTYSLQMIDKSNYYFVKEVNSSIFKDNNKDDIQSNNNKNFIILSQSESHNDEMLSRDIEPVDFCEVLLHSSNHLQDIENEFEKSFLYSKGNVWLSNYTFTKNRDNFRSNSNLNNNLMQTMDKFENNLRLNDMNSKNEIIDKDSTEAVLVERSKSVRQKAQSSKVKSVKFDNFEMKSRHRFMPKGMSPITRNNHIQKAYSLNGDEYYKDKIYEKFANDVVVNSEVFKLGAQTVKNVFSKDLERVKDDARHNKTDLTFDSQSLKGAILGQVDRKFIAAVINGLSQHRKSKFFVLFDQHAVDERINLENNLSDYIQDNKWKSIDIDPVSLVLNNDYCKFFLNHEEKFIQCGLKWTFTTDNVILLNAIPKAIIGRNPRQVEMVTKAVHKLISEQIKSIKTQRGNVSLYPKAIMELVYSEACRYSTKFGDKLSKIDCTNMIDSLAYCKTPFQCAHGRPVMAVMMKLTNNSRSYTVNSKKLEIFKKGL